MPSSAECRMRYRLFVDSKQMNEVLRIQRDIVRSYEDDMVKYAEKKDKSRIKECFQSIPVS